MHSLILELNSLLVLTQGLQWGLQMPTVGAYSSGLQSGITDLARGWPLTCWHLHWGSAVRAYSEGITNLQGGWPLTCPGLQ